MAIPGETSPRGPKITDQQLREELLAGVRPVDIARKYGISRAAVSKRVDRLQLTTTSATMAPRESERYVGRQVDIMEQIARNAERANLLMDACDRWLRDADDHTQYDVGPRAEEVDITYQVQVKTAKGFRLEKRKAKASLLLAALEEADGLTVDGEKFYGIEKGEHKHADPRELILKTQAETRQTVALFADLLQKLNDAQTLNAWRLAVIEEIAKESPDCGRRIAERIQRSIVLYSAFSGDGAALSGNGSSN